jgi:hypothetical protein
MTGSSLPSHRRVDADQIGALVGVGLLLFVLAVTVATFALLLTRPGQLLAC